jgi:electron transport complex protein RnfC
MNNLVSIKNNNHIDTNVVNYLNPDYIYIPIIKGYTLSVESNSVINKEDVLLHSNDLFIYSPISGTVLGKSSSMLIDNKPTDCIVIENDFKEHVENKKFANKYINEYSKTAMIEQIKKLNGCSKDFNIIFKHILVSGIDPDPYENTSSLIINKYDSKILETIDALSTVFQPKSTILAINNSDSLNVINLNNNIGTYPNIKLKLMSDIYPIGFKDILIKNIYNKREIAEGILYLTVEDIYNIYNVLKRNKPITEKLITVAGNAIEYPFVINVKIGTSIADIIKNNCKIINDKYFCIVNGLIAGTTLNSLNGVVTFDTRSIFLNTACDDLEKKCINCGLCNTKCPVGLNPKYLREHKSKDRSKCINCGLCTYICPSKINFKKYLSKAPESSDKHE